MVWNDGMRKLPLLLEDMAAFGLSGSGLSYLTNYGDKLDEKWAEFSAHMNDSVDAASAGRVVAAAGDLYDRVALIMGNLFPSDASQLRFSPPRLIPRAERTRCPRIPSYCGLPFAPVR